jgi:trimeric autotransporter adhesin
MPGVSQTATAQSITPNNPTWVANGAVRTIINRGNSVWIGGDFTAVGPNTGRGAALNTATGAPNLSLPRANNTVNAVVSDGSGGWYVGGTFTMLGDYARNRIAHILPSGAVDAAWNPNANSTVSTLVLSGSNLYAGGSFTNIGGQTRNYIAALSTTSGFATGWSPTANNTVVCMLLSGGTMYVGGTFTTIGGATRNRIAALSTTTGLADAGWNANSSSTVNALALYGTHLYAGGAFTTIGGATLNYIADLSTTTGLATAWNPSASTTVSALAVSGDGSTVYAGGAFTTIGGGTRNRIAAIDSTTGLATAWNPNASTTVSTVLLVGSTIYAGGSFTTIGGQTRSYIAALNNTTGAATTWDPNASAAVTALASDGTSIYAGGSFYSIGRLFRNRIAVLDMTTGAASPTWNPNAGATVSALGLNSAGTVLYVGGAFTTIGGATRNRIAALDTTTGNATAWNPNLGGAANALALSADGNTLYAGGAFTTVQGASGGPYTRNRIAAISTATGTPTAWNPNIAAGAVNSVALSGTTLYAGGTFTTIQGASGGPYTRNYIAAISTATGTPTAWNPNAGAAVNVVLTSVDGNTVYAGGAFTTIQGASGGPYARNYIAAIDASTGTPTAWDPNANAAVSALSIYGDTIFVGGSFTNIGGQWRNYLAGLGISSGTASAFDPNVNAAVLSLCAVSRLYAGGSFTMVALQDFTYFAEFQYPPPNVTGISPDHGNQGQTLTGVNITGTDLRNTAMTLQLKRGAETITGTAVTWVSSTQVTATFAIPAGATVATDWSVYLQNNDDSKSSTLSDAFTVEYPPPAVYSIAPDTGNNDGVVHITNLAGNCFRIGASVTLSLTGQPDIVGTSVSVVTANKITCDLDLTGAVTGLWDVTVTNTDGKHATLSGGFAVQHEGPTVTNIDPTFGINNGVVHITDLGGTSFRIGATVTLRKPGVANIDGYNVTVISSGQITCDFNLAGKSAGAWDVLVTNDDGQWGMLEDGFNIQYPAPVVSAISPDKGNLGETLTGVSIAGSDLRNTSMTVQLKRGSETIAGANITWVSSTQVTADFTIPGGATVGTDWSVFLQNNDDGKSSTLSDAFTVEYPPPVVTTITPGSGTNDGTVHITNLAGSGFRSGATVKLSMPGQPDIPGTGVSASPPGRIVCDFNLTGAAVGVWDVTVTNTDLKSGTLLDGFTVEYPAPTVTSIAPSAANNDAPVSITDLHGSNFRAGATVRLHKAGNPDINATSVNVATPGQITCDFNITDKAVGNWSVVVQNSDGKSATLEDGFNIQYPAPVVSAISPDKGNLGELLNNVTISGSDFRSTSMTVRLMHGSESIDGTDIHWVSDTQVTADFYIPYGATVGPGWDVFFQNNDDGKSSTLVGAFTVEYPDPVLTSITPSSGTNDGVTHITGLLGANFRVGAVVTLMLSGQPPIVASHVAVVSGSKITCDFDLAGVATGTWDVSVTNTDTKSGTLAGAFSVRYPTPTISSITPASGNNNEVVHITDIAGTNFRPGAEVKLHKSGRPDIDATGVTVLSPIRITCDVDLTDKSVGDWSVVVINDDGKSATLEAGFSIQYPPPELTGMTPNSGPAGTTVRNVTIDGGNFRNTSATIELQRGGDTIFGTNIRWVSADQVMCDLPLDGAPEGPGWSLYYAHNDDGKSAVLADAFTVDPAPPQQPVITSLSPRGGVAGSTVTIDGVNFGTDQGSSTVDFNGVPVASYVSWCETCIEVVVPGGATTGPVVVSTAGGTSNEDKDFTICMPTWYLAEGSTAWGFSTYITVMNPNNAELTALFTYMLSGGGTVKQTVKLPPLSQVTVNPAQALGQADFSTEVSCLEGSTISVDRTMSWTGQSASAGEGHCSVGTTLPSKTWYLPEGCSAYGFETWLLVQNPATEPADVTLTYMVEGSGAASFKKSVPAKGRATFNIADDIGSASASIMVSSPSMIIAERATYRNNKREGQESIGATYASKQFFLPEGTTSWGFSTYVLVQNPNRSAATVTLTYMTSRGAMQSKPFSMAPMTRATVDVSSSMPDTDFSTLVSSNVPIVAERAMYWQSAAGQACHDSIGLPQSHTAYYLPDGQTSDGRETYTLVQNPNSTSVNVDVIYYGSNGSFDVVIRKTLPPHSRATFNMADRLPSGRAAILVRCTTAGRKILAERSMYWNGRAAGTNTIGGFSD